ncbi:MAG TPA: 4-hydroxybenzoate 3-monooxygenase [Solirubrobacteraceae bacterium]|nr:4-hydroxybenzoate 3-monooxygenase [Solirubrobacteraceae bacterium]
MRTQVGIVGAGPAGLMLAMLLHREGIDCVVLEARDREYVEKRVRAGLLEQNTVDLLRELGVADRLEREGLEHNGIYLRYHEENHYVDMTGLTGRHITIYGQQEVVKDLTQALLDRGVPVLFEVGDVELGDITTDQPRITYEHDGQAGELTCDAIAGCDGFHGVSRPTIAEHLTEYDYVYEFGWLGILAEARPATDELIYAWHAQGFALYTMRSQKISRLYLQVDADDDIANWPDDRIWSALGTRLGNVNEGTILDKGITPMRSFVAEPMQHGRLFLAGDSAHIVPPTGAKGLNLAVNDARILAPALAELIRDGSTERADGYTTAALRRVWRAQDFSNHMTQMLHDLGGGRFQRRLQLARLEYVARSEAAARSLAENYVGLPAEAEF